MIDLSTYLNVDLLGDGSPRSEHLHSMGTAFVDYSVELCTSNNILCLSIGPVVSTMGGFQSYTERERENYFAYSQISSFSFVNNSYSNIIH